MMMGNKNDFKVDDFNTPTENVQVVNIDPENEIPKPELDINFDELFLISKEIELTLDQIEYLEVEEDEQLENYNVPDLDIDINFDQLFQVEDEEDLNLDEIEYMELEDDQLLWEEDDLIDDVLEAFNFLLKASSDSKK